MLNFTWWVNRKDAEGRNIFQGGFLGLDNIGIFDRSAPLPTGGLINQADGTAWMAMYSLNLMRIALELAQDNHVYEDIATKFFEHFLYIAEAMNNIGGEGIGLWDEEDEFYYDVLHLPDGDRVPLKVRSMVGLIPLFAVEVLDACVLQPAAGFHPPAALVSRLPAGPGQAGFALERGGRRRATPAVAAARSPHEAPVARACSMRPSSCPTMASGRSQSIMRASLSCSSTRAAGFSVGYVPGESSSNLFGGNSNWRGPIWMPVNYLLIESLQKFHHYYGDDFKVECPTGSGQFMTIWRGGRRIVAAAIAPFLKDADGQRPVFGDMQQLATDPHFGLRAVPRILPRRHRPRRRRVHQTGWTGLVALLLADLARNAL